MTKEEFISKIEKININTPDKFFFLEYNKIVYDILEENERFKHSLKLSNEILEIQGQEGNYNNNRYMLGLYNGMELIIALFETREPNFIHRHEIEKDTEKTMESENDTRKETHNKRSKE